MAAAACKRPISACSLCSSHVYAAKQSQPHLNPPHSQSKRKQALRLLSDSLSSLHPSTFSLSTIRKGTAPPLSSALRTISTWPLVAMASSSADVSTEKGESQQASPFPYRQFLSVSPYQPPIWARHLAPVPPARMNLGQFPTPIHRWALPDLPEGLEVFIKRDDLTGLQLSGNKVRKLEFLIVDAKAQGADCVITIGGIQSNHCRATAVAARYAGLDTFLILRTSKVRSEAPLQLS